MENIRYLLLLDPLAPNARLNIYILKLDSTSIGVLVTILLWVSVETNGTECRVLPRKRISRLSSKSVSDGEPPQKKYF